MFASRYSLVALCAGFALFLSFGANAGQEAPVQPDGAQAVKSPQQLEWEQQVPADMLKSEAFAFVEENPALPRVLLIGDSISVGYTLAVRKELAGVANLLRIPANAGPTTRGLENIDKWLGDKPWDVIHFNWGLHDLKHVDKAGASETTDLRQVPPAAYEANLERLVARLKQTKARLIWASTTPVPEGASRRVKGDEAAYNAIAARVMRAHGITINDLYARVLPEPEKYQHPKNVHFNDEGSVFLGKIVASEIRKALEQTDVQQE